jgi:hypothetical protein
MSNYDSPSGDSGRTSEQSSASTDTPSVTANAEALGAEHSSASEGTDRDPSSETTASHQRENDANAEAREHSAGGTSVRGETVGAQQDNLAPNSHPTGGHRSGGSAQRAKSIDPERAS